MSTKEFTSNLIPSLQYILLGWLGLSVAFVAGQVGLVMGSFIFLGYLYLAIRNFGGKRLDSLKALGVVLIELVVIITFNFILQYGGLISRIGYSSFDKFTSMVSLFFSLIERKNPESLIPILMSVAIIMQLLARLICSRLFFPVCRVR